MPNGQRKIPAILIIYISKDGHEASSQSGNGVEYRTIFYRNEVLNCLENCCAESAKFPMVRETHGAFNPKKWWGDKDYKSKNMNPFDSKNKTGSKRHTWASVARICYQILNGEDTNDDYKLASALERVAVLNLRKTPGEKKVNKKEFDKYLEIKENRDIFLTQIKRIKPNVIICGNTLNKIKKDEIDFRTGARKKQLWNKNSYYCFSNVVFINPYHPSNTSIGKDEYVNTVVKAYKDWLAIKDTENLQAFEWEK